MILFPNAKINLGLDVLLKRSDGYHDLETVFYPVGLSDMLELVKSNTFAFNQTGLKLDSEAGDNIVCKAYQLMKNRYKIGEVSIHLHKLIPFGAGLGGGSSDAAFTLKGLDQLFGLKLGQSALKALAAELGSDCAFFIENQASFATGRGEHLHPMKLDLSAYWLLLVKPDIFVSTAEAYANIMPAIPKNSLRDTIALAPEQWKEKMVNQFESSVFKTHPRIQTLKEALYKQGAVYASMSGSGSSVFGLFHEEPDTSAFSDHFVWKEKLGKG